MTIRIGDTAPNFKADTTNGPIDFHEWIGSSWAFFFSHPADFTPVCTTEMGRTSQLSDQFAARNVKPIGLSTDTVEEHMKWIRTSTTRRHHADLPDRGRQGPEGLRAL
jgi:alkyl hydroperoxide reductase subunit AhpC